MGTPPATGDGELVSVADIWSAIEQVVPRDQLADALATIAAFVPEDDGDGDAEWRAELVASYGTVPRLHPAPGRRHQLRCGRGTAPRSWKH